MDRRVVTSQPKRRMQCTTFVGGVVAVAAVLGAGVVGETSTALRSARKHESAAPVELALKTLKAKAKAPTKANVNVGSATQIVADVPVRVETGVSAARVNEALDSLTVDWRSVAAGWTINFKKERNGYLGLTYVRERKIEIYVRKDRTVQGLAHDIAHELGHVADVTSGTDDVRTSYLRARGLASTTPWWTCSGCTDLQVGAGDFAETFALLAAPPYKFYSELGQRPGSAQLVAVVDALPISIRSALQPL